MSEGDLYLCVKIPSLKGNGLKLSENFGAFFAKLYKVGVYNLTFYIT